MEEEEDCESSSVSANWRTRGSEKPNCGAREDRTWILEMGLVFDLRVRSEGLGGMGLLWMKVEAAMDRKLRERQAKLGGWMLQFFFCWYITKNRTDKLAF